MKVRKEDEEVKRGEKIKKIEKEMNEKKGKEKMNEGEKRR